jgi:PhnB protein
LGINHNEKTKPTIMKTINPYLIFNGNAEEAFEFYQSVFGGELEKVRFSDMPGTMDLSEDDQNKMAHIALPLAGNGQILMASDSTQATRVNLVENAGFHICIEPESRKEAERVYGKLSKGGTVYMPLGEAAWAELAAMFADRFGVQWMINYGDVQ